MYCWGKDMASIAQRQIERIQYLIDTKPINERHSISSCKDFRRTLTEYFSRASARDIRCLSSQPVFEALFEGYSFRNNMVSTCMQNAR